MTSLSVMVVVATLTQPASKFYVHYDDSPEAKRFIRFIETPVKIIDDNIFLFNYTKTTQLYQKQLKPYIVTHPDKDFKISYRNHYESIHPLAYDNHYWAILYLKCRYDEFNEVGLSGWQKEYTEEESIFYRETAHNRHQYWRDFSYEDGDTDLYPIFHKPLIHYSRPWQSSYEFTPFQGTKR